jgi:hypothetical protein
MPDPVLMCALAILLVVLIAVDAAAIWLLRAHGAFARFVPTDEVDSFVPAYDPKSLDELTTDFRGDDYLQLLERVMNCVGKCEVGPTKNIHAVCEHVRRGGGLLCSGMATLYYHVLRAHGIQARRVYLSKALFDGNDTHVTVEVLVEDRWVIADPTFHVGFELHGELVGAHAIANALLDGSSASIRPRFYGPVRYPPRLEVYYLHWLPLFNNVVIPDRDQSGHRWWTKVPPFRYWFGPIMYVQTTRNLSYEHFRFQDRLYFGCVVLLPLVLCMITGGTLIALLSW